MTNPRMINTVETPALSKKELAALESLFEDPEGYCPHFIECNEVCKKRGGYVSPVCVLPPTTGEKYRDTFSRFLNVANTSEAAKKAIRRLIRNQEPLVCYFQSIIEYAFYELKYRDYLKELDLYHKTRNSRKSKNNRKALQREQSTYRESASAQQNCIREFHNMAALLSDKSALAEVRELISGVLDEIEQHEDKLQVYSSTSETISASQATHLQFLLPQRSEGKSKEWWGACSALISAAMQAQADQELDEKTLSHVSAAALEQKSSRHGLDLRGMKNEFRAEMPNFFRRIDDPKASEALYLKAPLILKYSKKSAAILEMCHKFLSGALLKVDVDEVGALVVEPMNAAAAESPDEAQ